MVTSVIMEINSKIEIHTEINDIGKSIVQDVDENSTVIDIAIPTVNGLSYPLTVGDVIECNYNDGEGKIYGFSAKVIGRKIDKIPLIVLQRQSEFKKLQRREDVRVSIIEAMKYIPVDKCNESMLKNIEKYKYKKGHAIDISGGGMRIRINENLNVGQFIMINTRINSEPLSTLGKIVRDEGKQGNCYTYGIKFLNIDNRIKEDIIKFVFQSMRNSIKRNQKI